MSRIAVLVALVLALVPSVATAQANRDSMFNDIEDEIMCTTCNVPLNIAESLQADQERAELRKLIARGLSKQEILDELVDSYGDAILAEPKAKGFNLVAWVVPIAAALALAALGLILLPRWRRSRAEAAANEGDDDDIGPTISAADAQRLDDDLARSGA